MKKIRDVKLMDQYSVSCLPTGPKSYHIRCYPIFTKRRYSQNITLVNKTNS